MLEVREGFHLVSYSGSSRPKGERFHVQEARSSHENRGRQDNGPTRRHLVEYRRLLTKEEVRELRGCSRGEYRSLRVY